MSGTSPPFVFDLMEPERLKVDRGAGFRQGLRTYGEGVTKRIRACTAVKIA
jgi:hypothetical protein